MCSPGDDRQLIVVVLLHALDRGEDGFIRGWP